MMRNHKFPLLLLAGAAASFGVHAGEPAPAGETTGTFAGVTVAIDPSTGRLRQPTAAELAELRAKMPRASSGALPQYTPKTRAEAERTMRRHKDGHVSMQVSEDMMSYLVATQQEDGTLRIQHVGADGHVAPATVQEGADHE